MNIGNKKKILYAMLLVFLIGVFFILPKAQAEGLPLYEAAGSGVDLTAVKESGLADTKIETILEKFLTWLLGVVGIIALIGLVVSGIIYLISAGNDEMITKAKKYMTYCLVGIVVVLASFVIVKALDTLIKGGSSF